MATTEAVYKAIAQFGQLQREARRARKTLQALERDTGRYTESQAEGTKVTRESDDAHRDLDTSLKRVSRTVKALASEERDANRTTQMWSVSTRRATQDVHALAQSYDRATVSTAQWRRETDSASKDSDRLSRAVGQVSDALRSSGRDSNVFRSAMSQLRSAMSGGGDDANFLSNALGDAGDGMRRVRREAMDFSKILSTFKIPAVVAGVQALIGALSGLAAGLVALIPRLAQASAIMAGFPGIISGFVQGIGVAVIGFKGIGDAVKALSDQESARQEIQAEGVDAAQAVASAEDSLADAHDSVRDAQEALTDARRDALYALQDLRIEAERATIGEASARLRLAESRRQLREMQRDADFAPSDIEYRQALLDVRSAELDLKDARHQNERTQKELKEAEADGIAQSEQMVAAREQLQAATEAVTAAEQGLADAMQASTAASAEQQKVEEALKDLSPAARAFAKQLFGLREMWIKMRQTAQEGLLPGAGAALERLTGLFPILQEMIARTSREVGDIMDDLARRITSNEWVRDLQSIFRMNEMVIRRAGEALGDFLEMAKDFVIAARPVTDWLTRTIGGWIEYGRAATEAGRASGELQGFFYRAIEAAEQLGRILADTGIALFNIFKVGGELGRDLWDSIERGAESWREWTESIEGRNALAEWFENARPVIHETVLLLRDIGRAFFDLAGGGQSAVAPLIKAIRTQLLPAIVRLGNSVSSAFGPELIRALSNIADLFAIIGGQGGTLVYFLKTLNAFAETILWLIKNVPFLEEAFSVFFIVTGISQGLQVVISLMKLMWATAIPKLILGWKKLGLAITAVRVGLLGGAGIKGALTELAAAFPKLGLALGLLVNPITLVVAGVAALGAAAYLTAKNLNDAAATPMRNWAMSVSRSLATMSDTVAEGLPYWDKQVNYFVEAADKGGQAVVSNQAFANVLKRDVIPAMYRGNVEQATWNKYVEEAADRGLPDLNEQLRQYAAAQDKAAMEAALLSARLAGVNKVISENKDAVARVASVMGLTMKSFREEAIAAATQGGAELREFIDSTLAAINEWETGVKEGFDGVGDALSELSGEADLSSREIIRAFNRQLRAISDYQKNWDEVAERVPERSQWVLDQIAAMGMDGAALVEGLADANDRQFERILKKWGDTDEASKTLGETVTDSLEPAMDDLRRTLEELPEKIAIVLGLNFGPAMQGVADFLGFTEKKGLQLETTIEGKMAAGRMHSGGPVATGFARGGRPDEVDARLQKGEYVLSRKAVENVGGTSLVDQWHERAKRNKFHVGGGVGHTHVRSNKWYEGDPAPIQTEMELFRRGIENASIVVNVPAQKFFSLSEFSGEGGSGAGTAAMRALHQWIISNFDVRGAPFVAGPSRTINFQPGASLSQHAFGNASDYFASAKEMERLFQSLVRMANARSIRTLGHAIYNRRAWSWNAQHIGAYSGSNPHTDHVHVDALPQWAGPWPGHPIPPASYHTGGYVERPGRVHPGEYVLNAVATRSIGDELLDALNSSGFGSPAAPRVAAGVGARAGAEFGQMSIALEIDGTRVSRIVDVHSRDMRIKLPGR